MPRHSSRNGAGGSPAIHQEGQRHLEGLVDLAGIDRQLEAGLDDRATVGRMRNPIAGQVEIEIADRLDEVAARARSPPPPRAGRRRAARRRSRRSCRRETRSGRNGREDARALRQQHGRLADGRPPGSARPQAAPAARARRSRACGSLPSSPVLGTMLGSISAGRHVEVQPRLAPREKFRRADRSRFHLFQYRLVQTASLTCFASAIGKNSPPDSIPNIDRPSTTRSSPMSTRS